MLPLLTMRRLLLAGLLGLATVTAAPGARAAEAGLMVHDAWVQFVPGAKALAAYLNIMNTGSANRQLVGAESSAFERVELHVSRITRGVATMEPVSQLDVPASKTVKFAPGGLHVMLIGPKAPLKEGGQVELQLVFEDGSKVPVMATVKKSAGDAHSGHSGHNH